MGNTRATEKRGETDVTLKPEHIVEELNRTPKLKRDLIMKMMEVMLDSEAFLEAYPRLYDPRIADVDLEYAANIRQRVIEARMKKEVDDIANEGNAQKGNEPNRESGGNPADPKNE